MQDAHTQSVDKSRKFANRTGIERVQLVSCVTGGYLPDPEEPREAVETARRILLSLRRILCRLSIMDWSFSSILRYAGRTETPRTTLLLEASTRRIDFSHKYIETGMSIKNHSSILVLCAFLFAGIAQPAQAQFGVAGGLNFESADDIQLPNDNEATLGNARGYHLGVVFGFDLGPSSIRPGVFYRRVGTYEFPGAPGTEGESFDVTSYEVPIDLRFDVLATQAVRPYVLAGPQMTFPQGEGDFDEATEDISFSLNIGAGLSFGAETGGVQLQPEIRYELLGTRFIDEEFSIGDQDFEPEDGPSLSSLSLRLNLIF